MTIADTHSQTGSNQRFHFNKALFEEQIGKHCESALKEFKSLTLYYALFHISFFLLAFVEVSLFVLLFSLIAKSALLAFSLAALFLTAFSYFVLRFYFQAKKPEQFLFLLENFKQKCLGSIPFEKGSSDYFLSFSFALGRLASSLQGLDFDFYRLPKALEALSPLREKLSILMHWQDVHHMQEILFFASIAENIELVKSQPTDLEAHVSLANAYIALSKLYMSPAQKEDGRDLLWIPPEYGSEAMQQKFKMAAERAIEEFKILDDYAPNDPWVHAQLAAIYHDLNRPELEILEYEAMLKISPSDKEILFRLGVLYFQQGRNAKGLRIYEALKNAQDKKAEELISFYDAYSVQKYSYE